MIEVKGITKKYGSHLAVDNISFNIEKGNVYGFLGPNGAGKSTTMNIITGCLSATEGTVVIGGYDIFDEPNLAKRHIGYLPENPPLYQDMTPYEYLMFVAEAKSIPHNMRYPQVREVIDITGLEEHSDRLIKNLSKGYKQRVGIAQAMLGDPDVIILDEPTVGLDPKQIIEIRRLIKKLGEIKTVILSSHILSEISSVCDHIIIISHGKIVANDSLSKLVGGYSELSGYEMVTTAPASNISDVLAKIFDLTGSEPECDTVSEGYKITVHTASGEDLREKLFDLLLSCGVKVLELKRLATTLEDIFLRLTEDPVNYDDDDEDEDDEDYGDEDEYDEEEDEEE